MAIPVSRGGIDYPDFHSTSMLGDASGDVALSELAVRLGSGINYSRAGNIISIEQFNKGSGNWVKVGNDADATPKLITSPVENGYYAMSLQYSPNGNWVSYITRYIPIPTSNAFGITFSFSNLSTIQEFNVRYMLQTKSTRLDIYFRMSTNDHIFWVKNSAGVYENMGTYYISPYGVSIYSHWKALVIPSLSILRYVSVNETVFDTQDIVLPTAGGSNYGSLFMYYQLNANKGQNEQMFIDNIYVSVNEED